MRHFHKVPKPIRSLALDFLMSNFPVPSQPFQSLLNSRSFSPIEPIEGLAIFNGFQCPRCNYVHLLLRAVKAHFRSIHGSSVGILFQRTTFQRIPQRKFCPSFPVLYAQDTLSHNLSARAIRLALNLEETPFALNHFPGDVQPSPDPFIKSVGWELVTENQEWDFLFERFHYLLESPHKDRVEKLVYSYLSSAHDYLSALNFHVRSILGTSTW